MFLGTGQFNTLSTFSFYISTPFGPITTSKNSTSLTFHLHFSGFMNRSFSSSLPNTFLTNLLCPSLVSVIIRILSINVAVFPWFIRSWKRSFIIVWKVAGELVNPKYMTVGSYALICVVNAAFHSLPSLILMLLYLYLRSNFVNIFLFSTPSNISAIRDNGYLFFIIYWFMCW